ncbi:DUF1565 domain-containing protein [Candidatus Bathyarchaeota archaeon]|nr:DUF1565 domain-containing protein [Candidatus Bathyarchaeota archaeon]
MKLKIAITAGLILIAFFSSDVYLKKAAGSTTITVPDDYPSIQEAINAASEGDTVFVRAGVYHENVSDPFLVTMVIVNKSISLVGESKFKTILDGEFRRTPIVHITANDVTVTGFTICNSASIFGLVGGGIQVDSCNGSRIMDNIVKDTQYGVNLYSQTTGNLVVYNLFIITGQNHYSGTGVQCLWSSGNTVHHNVFVGNCYAIAEGGLNVWEGGDPLGGNCWSAYKGNDSDRNGIGDVPFEIYKDNWDDYPLMVPIWQFDGDVNYDGKVDLKDTFAVGSAYGSKPIHPRWSLLCDINHDLRIDLRDYFMVCVRYGESWA